MSWLDIINWYWKLYLVARFNNTFKIHQSAGIKLHSGEMQIKAGQAIMRRQKKICMVNAPYASNSYPEKHGGRASR